MPFRRHRPAPRGRRRRIRKLRLLVLLALLGVLSTASFSFGFVRALRSEIPALDPARDRSQDVNGAIVAGDGHSILAVLRGSQSRVLVPLGKIAPPMRRAIVAIEDRRFYEHRGIDIRGIARAIWADVRHKGVVEGGSTITQQFVKNAYVRNQRTIGRKLREAALAWQLEQLWSKQKILTAYLNTIYFGNGAYGIQQASLTYFGHSASKLGLAEAALLAGLPADPAAYDPVLHRWAARRRRGVVLRAMRTQGLIGPAQFRRASQVPLPRPETIHPPGTQIGRAPYFVNYVKQELVADRRYGASHVYGGGLHIHTSIDLQLQGIARDAISKWLTDPAGPSAALVAVDPRDGRVLAMIGGNSYRESQFNLAVQGERQPGSAFKPFVLATALEDGIAPSTTFVSEPQEILAGGTIWSVHNYENANLGTVDLMTATAQSDNTVYAQLTKLVGPAAVASTAKRLGIKSRLPSFFAIGLGAEAVNPLELARAFSVFARGGLRIDGTLFGDRPRAILSIGARKNAVVARRVLSPRTAAYVNAALQGVVRSGTGQRAALLDRPVAGKTGTTEEYGDAWFVGYTPQLTVAVWVGYPDKLRPMLTEYHGEPVAGGTYPALIWKSFMERAVRVRGDEPATFPKPPPQSSDPRTVVQRDGHLRLDNGVCLDTVEVDLLSDAPLEPADCRPNEVEVPRVVGRTLADARGLLEAQPLTATLVYKPARPSQRLDVVLDQYPARGRLSSYDRVTLVLPKPRHGVVVPRVVGLDLPRAKEKLRQVGLHPDLDSAESKPAGAVVQQSPENGVAASPGMRVSLEVGAG